MGLSKNPTGPLQFSTLVQSNDVIWFSTTEPPDIAPDATDIPYMVKVADRLDNIAAGILGDKQLSWVILQRNGLRLLPNDLVPGKTIFIPTRTSLSQRGII